MDISRKNFFVGTVAALAAGAGAAKGAEAPRKIADRNMRNRPPREFFKTKT